MTMHFDPPATAASAASLYPAEKQYRALMVPNGQAPNTRVLPDGTVIEHSDEGRISRVNYSSGTVVWIPEPTGSIFVTSPYGTTFVGREGQLWLSID